MVDRNRRKTNSITELVKIVAGEVASDRMDITYEELYALDRRLAELETKADNPLYVVDGASRKFCENIRSSLSKAGSEWTDTEDAMLRAEVRVAMSQMAKNHDRSLGSIASRIRQKEMTNKY